MKSIERILMKAAIIQFIILILSQIFFHQLGAIPQLKEITKYEGVANQTKTEIIETYSDHKSR